MFTDFSSGITDSAGNIFDIAAARQMPQADADRQHPAATSAATDPLGSRPQAPPVEPRRGFAGGGAHPATMSAEVVPLGTLPRPADAEPWRFVKDRRLGKRMAVETKRRAVATIIAARTRVRREAGRRARRFPRRAAVSGDSAAGDTGGFQARNGKLVAFRLLHGDGVYYDLTLIDRCFVRRIDARDCDQQNLSVDRARLDAIADRIGLRL
jgi:hypothetical protein